MDTLPNQLTDDQLRLLEIIAGPFLSDWQWPRWDYVERVMAERGLDAQELLVSLPRVPAGTSQSYGFTVGAQPFIYRETPARLTIAAALVMPAFNMAVGQPFLRVLHHAIGRFADTPPLPHQANQTTLTSAEVQGVIPNLDPRFVAVLPDIITGESSIGIVGGSSNQGTWTRHVTQDVLRFTKAKDIPAYVETKCGSILKATRAYMPSPLPAPGRPAPDAELERGPYIDTGLLDSIEGIDEKSAWSLDKLLALCRGLNSNYAARNPYSCLALIRAIIDHIPPAFGQKEFSGVVSNHRWTRTDKAYAQQLAGVRPVGDDVMHRQMRNDPSLITMDDLPPRTQLNAVLRELRVVLEKDAASDT